MKRVFLLLTLTLCAAFCIAADADYTTSEEYISLRNSMHNAFNSADSAKFFPAVKALEAYLKKQGDTHGYYNQRCNEIVFLMNQQKIFEAYKLARELSEELREKRNAILRHQSQMESAPFLGNDERLFWQRAEDRNRETAKRYDDLGLACYEAMEAFVEYKF